MNDYAISNYFMERYRISMDLVTYTIAANVITYMIAVDPILFRTITKSQDYKNLFQDWFILIRGSVKDKDETHWSYIYYHDLGLPAIINHVVAT